MNTRVEPEGAGSPVAGSKARAAFEAGDCLGAARFAAAEQGEDAQAILRAVRPDPVALWSGCVLLGIIAAYWLVVTH